MAYALDRQQIGERVIHGNVTPGNPGVIPPGSPWYNPDVPQYADDPAHARVLRARVATELSAGYIVAARAVGAHPAAILARHGLPATVPVATEKFVLIVQSAIVIEASLAFLGLSNPATIGWGGIIHRGVGYGLIFVSGAWQWWLVPPICGIALLVSAVGLIGWALESTY